MGRTYASSYERHLSHFSNFIACISVNTMESISTIKNERLMQSEIQEKYQIITHEKLR